MNRPTRLSRVRLIACHIFAVLSPALCLQYVNGSKLGTQPQTKISTLQTRYPQICNYTALRDKYHASQETKIMHTQQRLNCYYSLPCASVI